MKRVKTTQIKIGPTKNLFLHDRGINEIDMIKFHDSIELIDLHNNNISKLSRISQFKSAGSINLSNNQVEHWIITIDWGFLWTLPFFIITLNFNSIELIEQCSNQPPTFYSNDIVTTTKLKVFEQISKPFSIVRARKR